MDKNTIIGFVLIIAIVIGFTQLNKPSEQQIALKRQNDSIALLEQKKLENQKIIPDSSKNLSKDSVSANDTSKLATTYGGFSPSAKGEEKFYTLENELVKLTDGLVIL